MSTEADYPDPTEADLKDPAFDAIWKAIKGWDLSRGPGNGGHVYSGATGNDVMHVLLALRAVEQACAVPAPAAYPRKAIEVKVTANGFTWDEVLGALRERLAGLEEHREHAGGCSASGYGASHTCDVMLRDVDRDTFADESIAWLERQKESR